MTLRHRSTRFVTAALLAALTLGLIAPVAEASRKRWDEPRWNGPAKVIRYKGWGPARYTTRSEYVVRRSDNGAIVAGFLGGLFLGAVLANQAPQGTVYYDPSCGRSFARLDAYESYCRYYHRYPRVVRVVEVYPGYDHCPPPGWGAGDQGWNDQGWDGDH